MYFMFESFGVLAFVFGWVFFPNVPTVRAFLLSHLVGWITSVLSKAQISTFTFMEA